MRRDGDKFEPEFWVLDGVGTIVFGPKRTHFVPKMPLRRSPMDDWAALTSDMDRVARDFQLAVQRELERAGR